MKFFTLLYKFFIRMSERDLRPIYRDAWQRLAREAARAIQELDRDEWRRW